MSQTVFFEQKLMFNCDKNLSRKPINFWIFIRHLCVPMFIKCLRKNMLAVSHSNIGDIAEYLPGWSPYTKNAHHKIPNIKSMGKCLSHNKKVWWWKNRGFFLKWLLYNSHIWKLYDLLFFVGDTKIFSRNFEIVPKFFFELIFKITFAFKIHFLCITYSWIHLCWISLNIFYQKRWNVLLFSMAYFMPRLLSDN